MVIFELILNPFEVSVIFRGSWDGGKKRLDSKTEKAYLNQLHA